MDTRLEDASNPPSQTLLCGITYSMSLVNGKHLAECYSGAVPFVQVFSDYPTSNASPIIERYYPWSVKPNGGSLGRFTDVTTCSIGTKYSELDAAKFTAVNSLVLKFEPAAGATNAMPTSFVMTFGIPTYTST